MTAVTYKTVQARPAPINTEGLVAWLRINLFGDWKTAFGTVFIGALLLSVVPQFFDWAVVRAVWVANFDACHAEGAGACWGVVSEKYRIILLGRYPLEEQWRPISSTALLLGVVVVSCMRAFWRSGLG